MLYWKEIVKFDRKNRIFLDEFGAVQNMILPYARSAKGERAYSPQPTAPGRRISTLGALSFQGILTAMNFEGTLNGAIFLFFVQEFLLPFLDASKVVILDNASAHYNQQALELIAQTGATLLFLPPYSPQMNPIELAWSKVKHFLKKWMPRTLEELYEAISSALDIVTPQNAEAYFKHCFCASSD